MKYIAIIITIAVLIGAVAYLNRDIKHNAMTDAELDAQDKQNQKDADAKAKAEQAKTPPARQVIFSFPAEQTFNSVPNAKYKITVGWVFDEVNQPNPDAMKQVLDAVSQAANNSHGQASAEIVNLDVPSSELSPAAQSVSGLGIAVNGNTVFTINGKQVDLSGNPGEGDVTVSNALAALKSVGLN